MADAPYSLLDGLAAACRGSITETLTGTPVPPFTSARLDKAERLIMCAEVVAEIVLGDEIARDSVDDYEGLNGFRRGALISGIAAMLDTAGSEVHQFAASYANHCEASASQGGCSHGE